jgi:opacity protein-like surface antigen
MKLNVLSLSLGAVIFAAISVPASAADWNYGAGSMKDSISAAVPVPAPVPIPDYAARYYFRFDAGFGMGDAPDSDEAGLEFGRDSATGVFGANPTWFNDDFDTFVTLGAGVGTYIGDSFRADFTAETRTKEEVKGVGTYIYNTPTVGTAYGEVLGTVNDKTSLSGGIFLFNGYYDFNRGPEARFTPYVGAGVGFAWNELKRTHNTEERIRACDTAGGCVGGYNSREIVSASDKSHDLSFAAMATVGASYRLSDYALLDFNYRYLFVDSTDITLPVDGSFFGGASKISIAETHEHQIRVGLRFDVF